MQPYRSAHTHYIYKYKRREAAGVGGHAVQEITARGHPAQTHMRAKKRIMQLMRARLSVLPVVCHGSGGDGTDKTPQAVPAAPAVSGGSSGAQTPRPPPNRTGHTPTARLYLVAAHDPDPPDRPEPHRAHPRHPEPSRLSRVAASGAPHAPESPQTTPPKIVSNAHPGVPGDTLSPGEGILHHFTHPGGKDGEFSAAGGQLRERKNAGFDPKGDTSIIQLNNIAVWVKIYILDK